MVLPRFAVIKDYLYQQIESGQWLPGAAVPSENQLAEQFSVSRMTARRALTELTQVGLLTRSQGAGTQVAEQLPTGALLEIRNIADEIAERGHQHRADVLALNEVPCPAVIAQQLGLVPDTAVFFSRIRHLEVDRHGQATAIQLEERYVIKAIAPGYLEQDFSRQTPSAYLSAISPLSEADHWVEAVMPSAAVQDWLSLSAETPCLKLSRRTSSVRLGKVKKQQQIVNFAILYHPGDKYRLGGHLVTGV
jgi:GntR family histidine utilization transcriptional repressor